MTRTPPPQLTLRPTGTEDARAEAERLLDDLVIAMARRDALAALAEEEQARETRRDLRPVF